MIDHKKETEARLVSVTNQLSLIYLFAMKKNEIIHLQKRFYNMKGGTNERTTA